MGISDVQAGKPIRGEVQYVALDVSGFSDPETQALAQQANNIAEQVAQMHGMLSEIYAIFEQLKPLMGAMPAMPKLPPGMVLPPFMR